MMELERDLRNLIEENLAIFEDEAVFSNDDNIFTLGFVNSLFAMKIVNFIENRYNIEVSDDDLDIKNFSSVNKISDYVNTKLKN